MIAGSLNDLMDNSLAAQISGNSAEGISTKSCTCSAIQEGSSMKTQF